MAVAPSSLLSFLETGLCFLSPFVVPGSPQFTRLGGEVGKMSAQSLRQKLFRSPAWQVFVLTHGGYFHVIRNPVCKGGNQYVGLEARGQGPHIQLPAFVILDGDFPPEHRLLVCRRALPALLSLPTLGRVSELSGKAGSGIISIIWRQGVWGNCTCHCMAAVSQRHPRLQGPVPGKHQQKPCWALGPPAALSSVVGLLRFLLH